jgi:probable HAF family extracellular repeat protein
MVDLGTLGGPGSAAYGVNASGQVVGESQLPDGRSHAFTWTSAGGMVDLGTLGGASSVALAVNASGQVAGNTTLAGETATRAFSWTAAGGMIDLGVPGTDSAVPGYRQPEFPFTNRGLNAHGQIVGSGAPVAPVVHWSWTPAGGVVLLDPLEGTTATDGPGPLAVNDSGQVVGYAYVLRPPHGWAAHAFSWTASGGTVDLTPQGVGDSRAYAVNASGLIAGVNGSGHAVLWHVRQPPTITSVTATPNVLWPPNHKMVRVAVTVDALDESGDAPVCRITTVRSSEPIWVPGETDWIITGPLSVSLRAERAGAGPGRVYTITVTCTNAAGLSATKDVTVAVPHDRSRR